VRFSRIARSIIRAVLESSTSRIFLLAIVSSNQQTADELLPVTYRTTPEIGFERTLALPRERTLKWLGVALFQRLTVTQEQYSRFRRVWHYVSTVNVL
jgi:hypothetical protein